MTLAFLQVTFGTLVLCLTVFGIPLAVAYWGHRWLTRPHRPRHGRRDILATPRRRGSRARHHLHWRG